MALFMEKSRNPKWRIHVFVSINMKYRPRSHRFTDKNRIYNVVNSHTCKSSTCFILELPRGDISLIWLYFNDLKRVTVTYTHVNWSKKRAPLSLQCNLCIVSSHRCILAENTMFIITVTDSKVSVILPWVPEAFSRSHPSYITRLLSVGQTSCESVPRENLWYPG